MFLRNSNASLVTPLTVLPATFSIMASAALATMIVAVLCRTVAVLCGAVSATLVSAFVEPTA